jgi:peroxiredoxin (alkyl hydroperoxide reductase subunit C)
MLDENAQDSAAVRASYFIDPAGVIQAISWYPLTVGRSVDEMIRMVAALQRTASGEVMTPEGWRPGGELLLPPTQGLAEALKPGAKADWFYVTRSEG